MERLSSLDEYYDLMRETKKEYKVSFNNMYCGAEDIQRYIRLERIYFERNGAGLSFFLDEGGYYKLCLYIDGTKPFELPKTDKKILLRNIYKGNGKGKIDSLMEETLSKMGFEKRGISVQVIGEPKEILEKKKAIAASIKILNRVGYQVEVADESRLDEIEALIREVPFIQDYHATYKTQKEKIENAQKGGYLCIVDAEGKVCAATITWIHGNKAEGDAIAVKEECKMLGMAPVISYERLKRLDEKGIDSFQGWVLLDNEPSIRYHKSMGFRFMDKYAEEWIWEGTK